MAVITLGARFEDDRCFRGSDTDRHSVSGCPDGDCCRVPPENLASRWNGTSWSSVGPNSHTLAAMPFETIPGVDLTELYEYLERHEPTAG